MLDVTITVTINKDEYVELVRKAAVYDAYARKLTADKERGGFVCDYESAMFIETPKIDIMDLMREVATTLDSEPTEESEEGLEEFFNDEEWEKVVELAEEEKE